MASAAEQMASNISLANFAKATDLKKRLWFTLGALIIFRLLSFVPLPGIDPRALASLFDTTRGGVLDFFNMFSGGSLERMSIIAIGVMPYITASIVVQLATSMSPTLGLPPCSSGRTVPLEGPFVLKSDRSRRLRDRLEAHLTGSGVRQRRTRTLCDRRSRDSRRTS